MMSKIKYKIQNVINFVFGDTPEEKQFKSYYTTRKRSSSLKTKESLSKPSSGITLSRNLVVRDAYTPTDQSTTPFSGRLISLHISNVSSFFIRNFHIQPNISLALLASCSLSHKNWHWL